MLKSVHIQGFKSFAKKGDIIFSTAIVGIVGPNGSGKSNVAEAFRFVLGEQSMKAMRGSKGEDLIWNGTPLQPRANKASVTIYFDNTRKLFPLDFKEVCIERAVYRDGLNEYSINGSKVRLKDVHELLAKVHVGSTGHHIISQGQADKILNASPKDRREMLEDALGLTGVELKRSESLRKLARTNENSTQVELLRRETAPRLRFLEKQIEKKQKLEELQQTLAERGKLYLQSEGSYIAYTGRELIEKSREPRERLLRADDLLKRERLLEQQEAIRPPDQSKKMVTEEREQLQQKVAELRRIQTERERELGSIEGKLSVLNTAPEAVASPSTIPVAVEHIERLESEIDQTAKEAELSKEYIGAYHKLRGVSLTFVQAVKRPRIVPVQTPFALIESLMARKAEIESSTEVLASELRILSEHLSHVVMEEQQAIRGVGTDREKTILVLAAEVSELRGQVREYDMRAEMLSREKRLYEENARELITLLSTRFDIPEQSESAALSGADRNRQEVERQSLERLKIKLEEIGTVGEEVLREFADASARDSFLVRELEDLTKAAQSLQILIRELESEMTQKFTSGVKEINEQFTRYFSVLFGGGEASLTETREKKKVRNDVNDGESEEEEIGVDVRVHLPRKKAASLAILSGGERALTSIALIFAMSQVNPPPFIILDETDAALDEANSSRYADMIRLLSEHSQLIVITHNRATMAAAGTLYGVTMGGDGVSKLLSVRLEEAERVAK